MSEKNIIFTKLHKVEKIIHLADIHIRLYKRHGEYGEVFNNLYDSLKARNLKNTVIVVAGDIVHAKTDMSPEMVRIASEFLKNLADLAPTIIIAGNHDLNLANPNRLDALSPIVENLNHNQLYYLRESGVYQFADIEFGVHSIIGLPEDWPNPLEMSNKKIALYHGPLNKAQTDAGFTVSKRVTVESFSGYDMVLLGDIHKAQLLQEKNGHLPEIMYPGSLIQQNHGESLSGHGYAVWDVVTSKVEEYVEVKNPYGYYTLTLKDDKMPNISDMPENVRLRIFIGDIDNTIVKKVQATIRKKYTVVECTVSRIVDKTKKQTSTKRSLLDDIQDINHQNTLMKEYIENHFPSTSDDIIEKIFDINSKFNSRIGEDELPKNISWRPINLKFDNLFSYGEGNEIEFDDMKGLYGVFSPNATGKTSAFDALCFALYDKTPRAFKGSHIMNTRKDRFSCELEIEINGTRYIIQRDGNRKKNGEVKVDVNFYKIDGDNKICLNGEDRRDTNFAIRSYVGTYEDFILTTLSVQNQNSLFIDTGQSDRKDLLSQFIGLTIFDRLFNLASDEIKEIAGALKNFKRDDFTQKLADAQLSIEREQIETGILYDSLNEQQNILNDTLERITSLYEKKIPNIESIDPTPYREKIVQSFKASKQLIDRLTAVTSDESTLEDQRHQITEMIRDYGDVVKLTEEYELYTKSKTTLINLKNKLNVLTLDVKNQKENIDRRFKNIFDPNCQYCIANNEKLIQESQIAQVKFDKLKENIEKLEQDIYDGEQFINQYGDIEGRFETYQVRSRELLSVDKVLVDILLEKERLQRSIDDETDKRTKYNQKLEEYETNSQLIEQNKLLEKNIKELESERKIVESTIQQIQSSVQKHHGQLEVFKKKKEDMLQIIREAEELETTYDAYETYLSIIGRNGLPYELLSHIIPTLESGVNNILSQIVDFNISMAIDDKNINGKIVYEDNKTWPLELASGMEKFITGLVIRVVLMSVSNLPKSNFLIIDEGISVLDADNLSSLFILFNILKNEFDFLILISHLDIARDIVDNLIEIKKDDDGYSSVIL